MNFAKGISKEYAEMFEERAAILEFDGGLTRREAEKYAFFEIQKLISEKVIKKQREKELMEQK